VLDGEFGAHRKGEGEPPPPSPTAPSSAPKKSTKPKGYPFHGELARVESTGGIIELKGREKPRRILVTSETRISRDGSKVSLDQARSGEKVSGMVFRRADQLEQAVTLRLKGAGAE
jgi:hypothetical protein